MCFGLKRLCGALKCICLAALILLLDQIPTTVMAGQWHYGPNMVCSDCHTMHNSMNNAPMRYDLLSTPAPNLLRHATQVSLCLYCHDGTNTTAPDVLAPVTMYSGSGDEHSGAGFFENSEGLTSGTSHDLGVNSVVPLSTMGGVTLTCTSCHDPHGTDNYRNLLTRPNPSAGGSTVLLGTDVFEQVAPPDPPTQQGVVNAYKRSNIGYSSNMASWCSQCHDLLASNSLGSAPAHFMRHPSDVALNAYSPSHTDPSHWVGGTGEGFGSATGDSTEGVPRVRFQVAGATDYAQATTVSAGNQVFCPSCHLAHGGSYQKGLVWPFRENTAGSGGKDMISVCQQCHNH